jgi:SAM-dependent methyltransferase
VRYTPEWFQSRASGANSSAARIAPLVFDWVRPESVIDLGCGTGSWLTAFRDLGAKRVVGIDGDWVPRDQLEIPEEDFVAGDLNDYIPIQDGFDLAICLEVAEHLKEPWPLDFVGKLTRLASVVLFSAAVPGQPGNGHVNTRWPTEWAQDFRHYGYEGLDLIRPRVWGDNRVKYFYQQNTILYVAEELLADFPDSPPVRDFVHPELYGVHRKRRWRR